MRRIATTVAVATTIAMAGCTTMQFLDGVSRARVVIKAVNTGVMSIDEAARDLCPSLPTATKVAQGLACAADANGTTQDIIARRAAAWKAFCDRPAAKSLIEKGDEITAIMEAVSVAQAKGCFTQ